MLAFGSTVMVLLDCLTICPFTVLNALSTFDPRTLSLARIVESASSLKSSGSISIAGSFSKIHFSIKRDYGVFGFLTLRFLNADFPSEHFSDLSANSIFGNPSFSLEICFFVCSRALIDCADHSFCLTVSAVVSNWAYSMFNKFFCTKLIKVFTFENGSGIGSDFFGIPFAAINSDKNLINFSVVGFGKNSASRHPE